MQKIQDVFKRIKDTKKKAKEVKRMYRDALENSSVYRKVAEELKALKETKKEIENRIKEESIEDFQKLEGYKMNIQADNELLSELALNTLMTGETVKVTDEHEEEYNPVFTVRFVKAKVVRQGK